MADYSVWVSDAFGNDLTVVDYFHSLDYARSVNGVGVLTMVLPYTFDFKRDYRLGVWRKIGDYTYLDTDTVFLVRKTTVNKDSRGRRLLTVTALSSLTIVGDRIVAYYAGSAEAKKDDLATDDMMKAIIRENFISPTDTARSIAKYLTVDPDDGAGPVVSKAFAWRNVLDVLNDLSLTSSQLGYPIYYDVVAVPPRSLVFKTFPLIRGNDLSTGDNKLVLSEEMGSLTDVVITEDGTQEITVAYGGGQGEGNLRTIQTAQDDVRIGQSPFGRREGFINATGSANADAVQAAADKELKDGRVLFTFAATILDNNQARYGINWRFGDLVVANADNLTFNCMVDNVRVSVRDGKETISADLRVG